MRGRRLPSATRTPARDAGAHGRGIQGARLRSQPPRGIARSGSQYRGEQYRSEIQALRAVAVVAVVLYHLWPNRIPAGFVGVDVFFVISGFLITQHLFRELSETGTIRLARFYARRARRLLPASLVTLLATLVAGLAIVPHVAWDELARQVIASALYVQNWTLASDAVDYLAAESSPTAVQHFWSLAIEEQYYLIWPILLVVVAALLGSTRRRRLRGLLLAALGTLGALSFGTSLVWSALSPQSAYFATPTRIWEFAAGGLLAIAGAKALGPAAAAVASWAGLALIVGSSFLIPQGTPFPGWVAVFPVAGTVLVILGGSGRPPAGPGRLYDLRPVRFLGDISYGVYLWHWPLVVLLPQVIGPLTAPQKVLVLALSILLGYLSKILIEDPVRNSRLLPNGAPVRTLAATAIAMLLVAGSGAGAWAAYQERQTSALEAATEEDSSTDSCFGADALLAGNGCSPGGSENVDVVDVAAVGAADRPQPWEDGCIDSGGPATDVSCSYGDPESGETILLWGDSHAASWAPALDVAGKVLGRSVVVMARHACAPSTAVATATVLRPIAEPEQLGCEKRNRIVLEQVRSNPDITTVVLAARSSQYRYGADAAADLATAKRGYEDVIGALLDAGKRVVVLAELPQTGPSETDRVDVPTCLADHAAEADPCAMPRAAALSTRILPDVVSSIGRPDVQLVETSEYFCDDTTCYAMIGGVAAYFDASHLSGTYAETLGPYLADALR
jgi:peptidoglycan/LPS O-acetylase OafA/YrhL